MKLKPLAVALMLASTLAACGGGSDNNTAPIQVDNGDTSGDTGGNTGGDTSTPVIEAPSTYSFETQFDGFDAGTSAVKYTGQTARHMFIEALVTQTLSYTADDAAKTQAQVAAEMAAFFDNEGDTLDTHAITFTKDGVTFLPQNDSNVTTFGSISGGKSLSGKIAGNDTGVDAGALEDGLVNATFFGWDEGNGGFQASGETGSRPEDLTRHMFDLLADEVVDGSTPSIPTTGGAVDLDVSYVDGEGRDFRQLIQKFLLGAITFSQGTSDYLQTDFSADNVQDGTNPFTSGAHDWDEAFGYFGAAINYNDYTDDEIAAKGGRDGWSNGYNDINEDGNIDLRSEINLGNSSNCAKRDRGATVATDFTKTAFDAFIAGRTILNNAEAAAAAAGGQVDLTAEQATALEEAGNVAARTWEECIAATVVHYINDTTADINNFDSGNYTDLDHYKDLAKHWAEMKGFALGLQFNVESPIYDSADNLQAFEDALAAMGTGPVLADAGDTAIADYLAGLAAARTAFQTIYGFDAQNVENW